MRVSIVGTGYVGLVTGACLADRGHSVVCVDVDRAKVDRINAGEAPIHERDLPELLERNVGKRLTASTDLASAVANSAITFIAVGTPSHEGKIDLRFVEQAAAQVGEALAKKRDYHALIVKSTVIPGTTDGAVRASVERGSGKRAGADFGLGMNPEFLTEGSAVDDFMNPDRIVLGGVDERTRDLLAEVYASFTDAPKIRTNNSTAEMIKYASNSVLATLISYSNEIARVCSSLGDVDVAEVMRGVHKSAYFTSRGAGGDRVVAPITSFLEAGCGFGGSCLPKDVTALVAQGASLGLPMPLLKSVLEINRGQPAELMRLLQRHFPDLSGVRVAVLGIAFKPDTDDVRESPAFPVLRQLRAAGAEIVAYDPIARPAQHPDLAGVPLASDLREAVRGAQAVVLVTRWPEFAQLPEVLAELAEDPVVIDGRRMLSPEKFTRYEGIGALTVTRTVPVPGGPPAMIDANALGESLYEFVRELYPICRSITGPGLRETLAAIGRHVPLALSEVPSGTRVFDWEVPNEWSIREAWIRDASGKTVVDFRDHNLRVVNYSTPVHARMSLADLKPHLHALPEHPDWIPYRTSYYRDSWGFCLTQRELDALPDGSYEVCIDTTLAPGSLTLGECHLPGRSRDEVLIYTHACHPSLCNDNLSALAVATWLAARLAGRGDKRLGHRFVFGPATIGSITWLARNESRVANVRHGLVLASLGDAGGFTYKRSRRGDTATDRAAEYVIARRGGRIEDFSPYGYDERQFCSPGFDLAVGRLTRTPNGRYPEYHTSADDLSFVSRRALAESLATCEEILDVLEENVCYVNQNPKCEPRLGPRGLFRTTGGTSPGEFEHALLWVLNQSDGTRDLLSIAERSGLDFSLIARAARALKEADLLREGIAGA